MMSVRFMPSRCEGTALWEAIYGVLSCWDEDDLAPTGNVWTVSRLRPLALVGGRTEITSTADVRLP